MGDRAQEITYRKAQWFDGAAELIDRSECGTCDDIEWIQNQIRSGRMLLYKVECADRMIGIFTAFVDTAYNGRKDLVVVHAVSVEQLPFSFIAALDPVISALAKDSGFDRWRVHSQRVGMSKVLAKHGFKIEEIVFSKEVE